MYFIQLGAQFENKIKPPHTSFPFVDNCRSHLWWKPTYLCGIFFPLDNAMWNSESHNGPQTLAKAKIPHVYGALQISASRRQCSNFPHTENETRSLNFNRARSLPYCVPTFLFEPSVLYLIIILLKNEDKTLTIDIECIFIKTLYHNSTIKLFIIKIPIFLQ